MSSRSLVVSGVLAVTSLAGASHLQAQAVAASRFHPLESAFADAARAKRSVASLQVRNEP